MSLVATMSNLDLHKEVVYLAYRDIFKDKVAKLRKRSKVHNVVERHRDHLHIINLPINRLRENLQVIHECGQRNGKILDRPPFPGYHLLSRYRYAK